VKRLFVQRQAVKKYADPSGFDGAALRAALEARMGAALDERGFAVQVQLWEKNEVADARDEAMRYAAWATLTPAGREAHTGGTLFRLPARIDTNKLVPVETIERDGVTMLRLPEHAPLGFHHRARDGFGLTDPGMGTQQALVECPRRPQSTLSALSPHHATGARAG
jgi:hypothetical protein